MEHGELVVDGVEIDWRLTNDGVLHAATLEGVAAGLAWAAGQWPRRFEVAALLEDESRTDERPRTAGSTEPLRPDRLDVKVYAHFLHFLYNHLAAPWIYESSQQTHDPPGPGAVTMARTPCPDVGNTCAHESWWRPPPAPWP
ncbi:hypothetical protein STENM327S_04557 [Streptomyces tendae]